jgi:hypothetical protein
MFSFFHFRELDMEVDENADWAESTRIEHEDENDPIDNIDGYAS